jgi:DNA invertase Pin-like site-specific DNA recombinase
MEYELEKYGVVVKCLEETYDTSDPASIMLKAIKIAEPEMDNRRRAKNTQMGIRRALKAGRYASGASPIGYSWDRNGTHQMIKPNANAGLVKEAFELYATGLYFSDYLKSFQVHSEGSNLYVAIMEDIFKTKEGDRNKEIDRFQKTLAELEPKLLKIDEMYVAGDLEKDSYQRMKAS